MTTTVIAEIKELIQSGQKATAEARLRQLVAADETFADGWLWLGRLVKNPAEREIAWQNVLSLNPDHEQARRWLGQHYIKLADRAPTARAKQEYLLQAVELDERNQTAWRGLSQQVHNLDDRLIALENLRLLAPEDQTTAAQLAYFQAIAADPFRTAVYYREQGQISRAIALYRRLMAENSRPAVVARAEQEWRQLQRLVPEEATYVDVPPPRPWLLFVRFLLGPALLYLLLLWTQAGLTFRHIPLGLLAATALVVGGSWLMLAVRFAPEHPAWGRWLGRYGWWRSVRLLLWMVGGCATAVPYLWLLWSAWQRANLTAWLTG